MDIPVPLPASPRLADVAAIVVAGDLRLVTLDHTWSSTAPLEGHTTEVGQWRTWQWAAKEQTFRRTAEAHFPTPVANACGLAFSGGEFWAVLEANRTAPALLATWPADTLRAPVQLAPTRLRRLDLGEEIVQLVDMKPEEEWSTAGVPSRRWLFEPRLVVDGGDLLLGANTADGRAVVWRWRGDAEPRCLGQVPFALEPLPGTLGKRVWLVYRQPPPGRWSVFARTPRYSGGAGPQLLPLALGWLDAAPDEKPRDLATSAGVPPAYAFAAAQAGEDQLLLALLLGDRRTPDLWVGRLSLKPDGRFTMFRQTRLENMPRRLSAAASGQRFLVAWLTQVKDAYVASGWMLDPAPP